MKKVIVTCFALAIVVEASFVASVDAQLLSRLRFRQNRNNSCCCQQQQCGSSSVAVEAEAVSYEGAQVSYEAAPAPVSECGSCDAAPAMEAAPMSYEAPVESNCGGCCGGCGGEAAPMSYEGAAVEGGEVVYNAQPTLAQGSEAAVTNGETIISEQIISEGSVEATTVESPAIESTPATAPAVSEDSVPEAPAAEGDDA